MMNAKRLKAMLLCVLMVTTMLLFAACGEEKPDETLSKEAEYQVTVVDALGKPYSGVVVRFMKDGQQLSMQVVDENGLAKKTMDRGDYTVELMFTGDASDYHYEKEGLTLSAENTTLKVVLSKTVSNSQSLFAGGEEFTAYNISTGCTYVELEEGMNYFLFTPKEAGNYAFSLKESNAKLGYYGTPFFVQSNNMAEMKDNAFTLSIHPGMIGGDNGGTTIMVLGVEATAGDKGGILTIERIGDHEETVADKPWTVYQTTSDLKAYTLPAGAALADFDLTAATSSYQLVLNETDGFYHLNSVDGPVVLVRLGEKSKYLESFKKMMETSRVCKYFFDENGDFVKKESYSECLNEYIEVMDENAGVYPLTEDLKYIIQQRGGYSQWWDANSSSYLFVDENGVPVDGINNEIAWLFMCCYVES